MFKKQFSANNTSNLRSRDRKELFAKLPQLAAERLKAEASSTSHTKIVLSNGIQGNLYTNGRDPVLFDLNKNPRLFPTLYFSWAFPSVFPTFLVSAPVVEFINKGADLMLPGILVTSENFPATVERQDPVQIAVFSPTDQTVFGPVAIGRALLSSREMFAACMKGKGVEIQHVVGDCLWELGSKQQPPTRPFDEYFRPLQAADEPEEAREVADRMGKLDVEGGEQEAEEKAAEPMDEEPAHIREDRLLKEVFLWSLKNNAASISLPMDVGQFYATFVLKQLPVGVRIDLKKTSHKKFTTFLKWINEDGQLLKIASKKGLDSIQEINFQHELVRSAVPVEGAGEEAEKPAAKAGASRVSECFSITEAVMLFFGPLGRRKGDVLQQNEIREDLIAYAQSKGLLNSEKRVELDDTLQTLVRHFVPDRVPLNELVQKIAALMTKCWVATLPDGRRNVRKNHAPSIVVKVEKRSGNKTVTLINNTAFFGVDPKAFCQKIQTAVATGASINADVPNCEGPQILVHGNQVHMIGESLQNDFGIAKKYIKGLELAVKPQKKKH